MKASSPYQPGEDVVWHHVPRGGYGYTIPVNVTVRKVGAKRVQVEAPLKSGATKLVWVKPESLRRPPGA